MTTKTTPSTNTPSGTPSETPSGTPAGTSVVPRTGGVPGPLYFVGTPLVRPLGTDPTHGTPSEVPTQKCGTTHTTKTSTWTCTIQGPHNVTPDGHICHHFTNPSVSPGTHDRTHTMATTWDPNHPNTKTAWDAIVTNLHTRPTGWGSRTIAITIARNTGLTGRQAADLIRSAVRHGHLDSNGLQIRLSHNEDGAS